MLGRKLLLAVAGALVLAAGIATAAGAALETEDLVAPAATFSTTASCNTEGTSTVSWSAQGVATGPYPGTFTLSGSLTIGPQTLPGAHPPGPNSEGTVAGPVESFQETFTIQSGLTTITGTKTLHPLASGVGTCQQVSQFPVLDFFDGHGTVVEVTTATHYVATISGPAGSSGESGTAYVSLSDITITGSCPAGPACEARLAGFNQTFGPPDDNVPCVDEDDDNNRQDDDDDDDECEDEDEDEDE